MKVKIGYHTFEIVHQPEVLYESQPANGLYDEDNSKIFITDKISSQRQKYVLLHEVLHCVEDVYSVKLTEEQIKVLATGLIMFIQDNKDIVDYLSRQE
jgi:Zn-dependent peptidase ImmA (M78 family)